MDIANLRRIVRGDQGQTVSVQIAYTLGNFFSGYLRCLILANFYRYLIDDYVDADALEIVSPCQL